MTRRIIKIKNFKTKFTNIENCEILVTENGYRDGSTAIQIFDNGMRELTATVSLPVVLDAGSVLIKNWSENEGVLDELIEHGIISKPHAEHRAGFTIAYEANLLA